MLFCPTWFFVGDTVQYIAWVLPLSVAMGVGGFVSLSNIVPLNFSERIENFCLVIPCTENRFVSRPGQIMASVTMNPVLVGI